MISYIIYLCCCAFMGVMCKHLDIDISQWEWWALTLTTCIAFICGRENK